MAAFFRRARNAVSLATLEAAAAYTVTGSLPAAFALAIAPLMADHLRIFPR